MDSNVEVARRVVQDIQLDKHADADILDPTVKHGLERLKATLQRSIEKLVQDIYVKPSHFVLEFVQNVDDSRYPDQVSLPTW